YFVSGQCSEKTDVYAFGVFLLELVSGKDVLCAAVMAALRSRSPALLLVKLVSASVAAAGGGEGRCAGVCRGEEARGGSGHDSPQHVSRLLVEGKADVLVDAEVKKAEGAVDMGQVEKILQVALLCLKNDPAERPTMEDVAKMVAGSELTEKWQQWQVRGVGRGLFEVCCGKSLLCARDGEE
ncbi:unnamed protein product, partial [Closterium sp. Naga37s-1]